VTPLRDVLTKQVSSAFAAAGYDPALGEVVSSQRPDLGQFQCSGVLATAKKHRRAPQAIADDVIARLQPSDMFSNVSFAPPGFINLTVRDEFLTSFLEQVGRDERLGCPLIPDPGTVVLDFGGPNIAKAMHVGHLRSTIIGDSLQRLFRFAGHKVVSDIHLGDWGTPMGMLIAELQHRRGITTLDAATAARAAAALSVHDLEEMYLAAAAQSRSEAILLGELRQNQEQLTRLSAIVSQLAEQMKALDKRLVDQETATSKGFADQRVTITGLQSTMQTMREKLEDSALRTTQTTQEIAAVREGVRMLYDQVSVLIGLLQPPTAASEPAASTGTSATPRLPQMPASPVSLMNPAMADYLQGRYPLAIDGFEEVVKTFPGSPEAAKAQFFIGESYNASSRAKEAIAAYDKVIANYKDNEYARDAMYMKGVTLLDKLKNPTQARATLEALIKQYPNTNQAINAEQGLKKIKGGL